MAAAENTGPAAQPLPLFYALSQAGRAIVAARGGRAHRTHGLTVPNPDVARPLLSAEVVFQDQPGQFQAVAEALGSPGLSAPVELGALLASMPELDENLLPDAQYPRPLAVWPDESEYAWLHQDNIPVRVVFAEDVRTSLDVAAMLDRYPAARERCVLIQAETMLREMPRHPTPTGMGVNVLWIGEGGGLDNGAPEYRWRGRRWLRPALVGSEEPPTPLLTWWALLFSLSMLARYHPVAWIEALNPNTSPIAVALENAMSEALEAVPHLVLEAIIKEPVLG